MCGNEYTKISNIHKIYKRYTKYIPLALLVYLSVGLNRLSSLLMSKKKVLFTMRFSESDIDIYDNGRKLAQKRRISLAELLRQLLIAELKANGIDGSGQPPDKPA
jgi:hypothetical protein